MSTTLSIEVEARLAAIEAWCARVRAAEIDEASALDAIWRLAAKAEELWAGLGR